ncbi:hypothetical protein GE09DRAFT_1145481 [Coniochaeta sp. 2T2.1]|nr:hypothetical protein GE09DRAFT_1145481 [Coniochaeta sp. 2T2.1]
MNSTYLTFSKQVRGPSSRSKLACKQCRERHVKCDQRHPCGVCVRRGVQCSHGDNVVFTPLEWTPNAGPELRDPGPEVSHSHVVGFINETSEISQLYDVLPVEADEYSPETVAGRDAEHVSLRVTQEGTATPITDEKEAFYLARYTDIIGPRFDMFDSTSRYFSLVLPHIALRNRLVLLACIASAARQYSLVTNRGHHDALAYYNEAIKTLSGCLNGSGHEAATFASCLLIAHCEMVESKASDWILHLKGTGELVTMQKWNGRSGGLAQASFWIYCRMMILASLSSGMPATVDLEHLLHLGYFPDPLEWTVDTWQRKTVYLLGYVQHFWARSRDQEDRSTRQELQSQWADIGQQLLRHECESPPMCQALSITPANRENPFESVRYINGPVSAAWQMLHTASLIHTISRPATESTRLTILSSPEVAHKALLCARKVVSISLANSCMIAWANAVQLLTVAGKCLPQAQERQACLRVLDDIQHHTGWDTRTNMETLSRAWNHGTTGAGSTHSATNLGWTDNDTGDLGHLLFNAWTG